MNLSMNFKLKKIFKKCVMQKVPEESSAIPN